MWRVPDVYARMGVLALLWAGFVYLRTRDRRWQAMEAVEAWYKEAELGNTAAFEALGAAIQALKHNL
jgi:NhaP-type Na+/H+ or K+/H+ antiporter